MAPGYWVRKLFDRAASRSCASDRWSIGRRRGRWLFVEALERRLAPAITFSVANPMPFPEGASGTMMFVVTRSGDTAPAVQVDYTTQDGTAHASTDYVATSGTLSYGPGETMKTIAVPILGHTMLQPARSFTVTLSKPLASAAFTPQQTFAAGSEPISVALADVNGDGRPDLAVANENSNTVSVLLNTTAPGATTPSFAPQQTFATGSNPFSVAVADVNNDGKPDLAVANENSNTVSVLLNTTAPGATTPSFAPQQTFATGSTPLSVAVADVNGDGRPDLAVANENSNTVSVLLNTMAPGATAPSFAPQQTFATDLFPTSVAVADVNGDGRPDLVTTNQGSDTVSVLLNTKAPGSTTPNFAAQQTFATGRVPFSVAVADFNGDGKPDLVMTNLNSDTVSVLLNTTAPGATAPSFAPQQTFATGSGPFSVAVADVNGDGRPDLVVANDTAGSVSVLLNTTAPGSTTTSFAPQQTFATGFEPLSLAVTDVNGDGRPDLVVANAGANTVSVLLNTTAAGASTPSFAAQETFASGTGAGPKFVAVADLNGDGKTDLVLADNIDTVSVLLNMTAPGATTPSFAAEETFATGSTPLSVAVTDVNGDASPDLIVVNENSNTVSVLLNTTAPGATTPSFASQGTFATGRIPESVALADVDGDGKPDMVVANLGRDTASVLLNTTAPGASVPSFAPQQTFDTGTEPFFVALADLNADGKPDMVVANEGSNAVSVLLNNMVPIALSGSPATGTIGGLVTAVGADAGGGPLVKVFGVSGNQPASFFAFDPAFPGGVRVAVGDVNRDGIPDIIVAAGPGGGPDVKIIDGTKLSMVDSNGEIDNAALLGQFYAYSPFFTGGVFVAFGIANGLPQIITGAGAGGGPHVKVIDSAEINTLQNNGEIADSALVAQFYAYSPLFAGGVRIAAADLNSDGVLDIVTGAGPGGGPHVKAINGTRLGQLQNNAEISDSALIGQFYAYTPTVAPSGGLYVAATDIDGHPIIITGDGPLSSGAFDGPRVKVIDATKLNLLDSNSEPTGAALLGNFFAYDPAFTGGVTVGAAEFNSDGLADIVTGAGPGGGPHVKVVNGTQLSNLQPNDEIADAALLDSFFAFSQTFTGGVFVGAGA
jgi:hypothetical protein